jgi:hypothetical protein
LRKGNGWDPDHFAIVRQAKSEAQMKEHRKTLARQVSGCTKRAQALFCLACAERLLGCCWAFQQAYGVEMSPFFRWSDTLFNVVVGGSWELVPLDVASKELVNTVPDSERYGLPLAVQAQSGVLCVLAALRALEGEGTQAVVECSNGIVDALDNYTFSVAQKLSDRAEGPKMYNLLERECARQMHDVAFLRSIGDGSAPSLSEWRIENRQYSVPIVVPL